MEYSYYKKFANATTNYYISYDSIYLTSPFTFFILLSHLLLAMIKMIILHSIQVVTTIIAFLLRLNFFVNMSSVRTLNPDVWWIYLLDLLTILGLAILVVKKRLTILNSLFLYSIVGLFYTFYTINWSRIIIKNAAGIVWALAFGTSDLLSILFILVSLGISIFVYYKIRNFVYTAIIVGCTCGLIILVILSARYYKKSGISPESSENFKIVKVINNDETRSSRDIINLSNKTDIRAIKYSLKGHLLGVGGNWLVSEKRDVIFSYNIQSNSIMTAKGWEVKCLDIDEEKGFLFFADFSLKKLEKWDFLRWERILAIDTEGVIQDLILSKDRKYLFAVYDDLLVIDQIDADSLKTVRRLDIKRSGICKFGALGMSVASILDGDYIIAGFANCSDGIIKVDSTSMMPVLLQRPAHNMIWSVTSSPSGGSFYVSYPSLDYIAEYDSTSLMLKRRFKVGLGIRSLLPSVDRKILYASNYFNGDVYIIDLETEEVLHTIRFPRKSYALAEDPLRGDLYVGGPAGVWKVIWKRK